MWWVIQGSRASAEQWREAHEAYEVHKTKGRAHEQKSFADVLDIGMPGGVKAFVEDISDEAIREISELCADILVVDLSKLPDGITHLVFRKVDDW